MMPRDILTTVLQRDSAWYIQRQVRRRLQRALDATIRDVPILMHADWKNTEICCVCERLSECYFHFLHPREQGSETYVRGRVGLCRTCTLVFNLNEREREFQFNDLTFVAFRANAEDVL